MITESESRQIINYVLKELSKKVYPLMTDNRIDLTKGIGVHRVKVRPSTELEVATNTLTVMHDHHTVTFSGAAVDVNTINGLNEDELVLLEGTTGKTITLKHGVDNINLKSGADFSLTVNECIVLFNNGSKIIDI